MAATLRVVPVAPPEDDLEWAVACIGENNARYENFESYYAGDHPLNFATEKFRNAFGSLLRAFAANICPSVVDAVADRLVLQGWDGSEAPPAQEAWKQNRMARVANGVHLQALRDGDSYVMVWPDASGKARIYPQDADACCVRYDEDIPGHVRYAAKAWINDEQFARVNLYYEDRIERYVSQRKIQQGFPDKRDQFTRYSQSGDVDDIFEGWRIANTWGVVPMFHFANNAGLGEYGKSELADVVPLQDAINKCVCDLLVAMEFQALPQRWATGLEIEVDPDTGEPRNPPFTPGADRIWTAAGDVRFGQFDPAALTNFVAVHDMLLTDVARITGTPLHYLLLSNTFPSGEAMKVAEGRLIKKVKDRQISFGDVWTDVFRLAIVMNGGQDEATIEPVWENPAPHNPLLDSEVQIVKQQIGVSTKQSLRELGYTEEQIQQMEAENKAAAPAVTSPNPTAPNDATRQGGQVSLKQDAGTPMPGGAVPITVKPAAPSVNKEYQ